jgi:hypothetical protein
MSRYFVNDPPVPIPEFDAGAVISDTPPNVIYIRSRMDIETRGKVSSELVKIGGDNKTMEMQLGQNQTALLIHNIVRWEGPDFDGVPCDAAHIRTLDPNEPHIEKVLREIDARNLKKVAPNPKPPIANGFATNGSHDVSHPNEAGISLQLATGISRSPLLRALDGHQNRSDD